MKIAGSVLAAWLLLGNALGNAEAGEEMEALIRDAAHDRRHVTVLMMQLVSQPVYVIARVDGARANGMLIQDFIREGRSFIPVFSDEAHFRAETRGSGFEDQGVTIDGNLLASMLRGDELLVLNPGSMTPVDLNAKELKSAVDPARLPKGGI